MNGGQIHGRQAPHPALEASTVSSPAQPLRARSRRKVFNAAAPVIKLPPARPRMTTSPFSGLLNSFVTACFWLKQVAHEKQTDGRETEYGSNRRPRSRMRFAGTQMAKLPLPPTGRRAHSFGHFGTELSRPSSTHWMAGDGTGRC